MLSVHHEKKSIKQSNKKNKSKKAVKVVYISNPIKFKTSASEFSALVQELTGQDADVPPDASKFLPEFQGGDIHGTQQQEDPATATATSALKVYPRIYEYQEGRYNNDNNIETLFNGFDNVERNTQMVENDFHGLIEPSNLWYDDDEKMLSKNINI